MFIEKHRIYCQSDSKWEYVWLPEGSPAPTTCPTNTGHTVDSNSVAIVDREGSEGATTVEGYQIVANTFEHDEDKTKVWDAKILDVSNGITNIFDSWVEADALLRTGWFQLLDDPATPKAVIGDKVEFAIIDKDDVLGLFSTFNLTKRINEVQTVTFSAVPTAGTWTLSHGANETANIAYDASASVVQKSLRDLDSLKHVLVTGDYSSGFTVTFAGNDGGIDQPELTSDDVSLTGATISHATTTTGVDGDILELTKNLRNYPLAPWDGNRQIFDSESVSTVLAELFMRVYVYSEGTEDYKLTCCFAEYF